MEGIYSALLTAFHDDGSFNPQGQREIVRYAIDHCAVDGIFVCGTIGERYKLDAATVIEVFKVSMDESAGKVQTAANISALSLEETIALSDAAYALGYQVAALIPPFFYQYSSEEMVNYFLRVADRSKLPILIYYIPSLTYVDISVEMFDKMLAHPNIIGAKFTHNDFYKLDRVRTRHPDAIMMTGFDQYLYNALSLGTNGAIGGSYNITGRFAKKLLTAVRAGDQEAALAYQHNINDVEDMLIAAGEFHTLKATMELLGVHCGSPRIPSAAISDAQWKAAAEVVQYLKENNG